jgi:hypothetical protein
MADDDRAAAGRPFARKRIGAMTLSYSTLVAVVSFSLLALLIGVAVGRGRAVQGGFGKLQFEIFELNREHAVLSGSKQSGPPISKDIPADLADRIKNMSDQIAGSTILWVDDAGATQNVWERRALNSLGIAIDTPTTTNQALSLLRIGVPLI